MRALGQDTAGIWRDMKWAIPADCLLKCQSGTLPPPPFTELNISLCQNKLGNPQIFFFLSPDFSARTRGAKESGKRAGGSAHRQFSSHKNALTYDKAEYWYWQLLQSYQSGRNGGSRRATDRFPISPGGCSRTGHPTTACEINSWAWSKATKANT